MTGPVTKNDKCIRKIIKIKKVAQPFSALLIITFEVKTVPTGDLDVVYVVNEQTNM